MNWCTCLCLASFVVATSASAQEGAKASPISFPKPGGTITLLNCVVTKIEPDGVRVSHSTGTAKVPYEFMPEEWKKEVPYDEDAAKRYRKEQEETDRATIARVEKEKLAIFNAERLKRERNTPKFRPYGNTWIDRELLQKGAEIVCVRIISVDEDTLIAEKLVERIPGTGPGTEHAGTSGANLASSSPSNGYYSGNSGSAANANKVVYWPTGTFLILKGNLPKDVADDDEFCIQANRDGTTQYDSADGVKKTVRIYQILRHNAPQ